MVALERISLRAGARPGRALERQPVFPSDLVLGLKVLGCQVSLKETLRLLLLRPEPLQKVVNKRFGIAARGDNVLVRGLRLPIVSLETVQDGTDGVQSSLDLGTTWGVRDGV